MAIDSARFKRSELLLGNEAMERIAKTVEIGGKIGAFFLETAKRNTVL